RFIEASEMAVRESHEGVGTRGRIKIDQELELFDGFVRFAGHEIALAESGVEIGAAGSDFYTGFEERDSVLEIILGHADAGVEKNNVGIFRSKFVRTGEKFQSVYGTSLVGVNLREYIKNVW